jgi:hypothetical protein
MIPKTLCAVTVHDNNQGVSPGPPHPSARLSRDTFLGYPWVTRTLSQFISLQVGRIASDPATIKASKFMRPHKSRMYQYTINACSS